MEWLPRVALVGTPVQLIPCSYLVRPAGLLAGRFLALSVDLPMDMRSPFAVEGRKKASFLRPNVSILPVSLRARSSRPVATLCAGQRKYSMMLPKMSPAPSSRERRGEGPVS